DPTTAFDESNTFKPFETRRIAAGDVNNDGQTDLMILDLNPADVAACAEKGDPNADSGDGTPNRATCTIKYDLLTLISRGDGCDIERPPTQGLREGNVAAVPGSLEAADLNGDGHADAVFMTGTLKSERFQTLKKIRTAIRNADGSYQFADVDLPPALSASE